MTNKDLVCKEAAILEHQGTAAKTMQYKVKWLGYPEPDWQLLANLNGGCRDLLRDYHRIMGLLGYRWMLEG